LWSKKGVTTGGQVKKVEFYFLTCVEKKRFVLQKTIMRREKLIKMVKKEEIVYVGLKNTPKILLCPFKIFD